MGVFKWTWRGTEYVHTLDWLLYKWVVPLMGITGVGSGFAWAAGATALYDAHWPMSLVLAASVGVLIATLVYAVFGWARVRNLRADIYAHFKRPPDAVNPLEPSFTNQRIRILDFADPVTRTVEGKVFVDCDFIGPGAVAFSGCLINGWRPALECDFAALAEGLRANNVINPIKFKDCTLTNPRFMRLVLFFPSGTVADIRGKAPDMPWLTKT